MTAARPSARSLAAAAAILRHFRPILCVWVAVTAALGLAAMGVRIDPEVVRLLPRDDAAQRLLDTYGAADKDLNYLIVVLRAADPFAVDGLQAVEQADRAISADPLVVSAVTPLNLPAFRLDGERLQLGPALADGRAPASAAEAERVRAALRDAPEARNLVLAADGAALALLYAVAVIPDYQRFMAAIEPALDRLREHYHVTLAGWIPLHQATMNALQRDPPILGLLAAGVLVITLLAALGRLPVTLAVIAVAASAAVWATGLMRLTGVPIGIITLVVPILVIALTSSYGVHLAFRSGRGADVLAAAAAVIRPVSLAAATTIAGFLTLVLSSVPRLREFGLISAAGVAIGASLCLIVLPAALGQLRLRPNPGRPGGVLAALQRTAVKLTARPRAALIGAALVLVLFAAAAPAIRYETDFAGHVRGESEAVAANAAFMRDFGGFIDLNVTLQAPDDTARYFTHPHVLTAVEQLEARLDAHADVSHLSSFTTSVAALRRAAGASSEPMTEADRPLIELAARLSAMTAEARSGPGLGSDRQTLTSRLWVLDGLTGGYLYERGMSDLAAFVRQAVDETLPEVKADLWGWSMFTLRLSELLRRDQIVTTISSMVLVVVLTAVALRSFLLGLAAVAPLAIGIMATATLMAAAGLPFDALSVMVASLAIGIGIDDALHLLVWYQRERAGGAGPQQAVRAAVAHAGCPILVTSAAICFGMLALVVSTFVPVARFGLLLSVAIAATTAGALSVLPALLTRFARAPLSGSAARQPSVVEPQQQLQPRRMPRRIHPVVHKRVGRGGHVRLIPQSAFEHAGRHDGDLLAAPGERAVDRAGEEHRSGTEGYRKLLVEPKERRPPR